MRKNPKPYEEVYLKKAIKAESKMPKIVKNLKILVINLKAIQLGLKIMNITIMHYNYIKNVEIFLEMYL